MSFVETEINGQIITIRLNRPERLNALSTVIRRRRHGRSIQQIS